ncbi:uncharacterized protein LOC103986112 isoform X5 [Musa acuminata AAA Group]|uniref:uncharacterized protein LOC103986112 isoform X5 n=1 Tax=Musa acuminata AAA Group TaxID=214697 RepID=UPI0031D8EA83
MGKESLILEKFSWLAIRSCCNICRPLFQVSSCCCSLLALHHRSTHRVAVAASQKGSRLQFLLYMDHACNFYSTAKTDDMEGLGRVSVKDRSHPRQPWLLVEQPLRTFSDATATWPLVRDLLTQPGLLHSFNRRKLEWPDHFRRTQASLKLLVAAASGSIIVPSAARKPTPPQRTQLPSSCYFKPPLRLHFRRRPDREEAFLRLFACVMAKEYRGEELWLPSHFLCDAFFLEGGPKNGGETVDDVAGLAQQMARYFLPCAHEDAPVAAPEHAKAMARSPQSTLCAWSTSNKGSPNGPSLVSSPPSSSPLAQRSKDDPCDLLCEAADQVMLLRRLGDLGRHRTVYDRGVLGPPRLPLPATFAISRNIDDGYDASTPVFTLEQLQAARFYHLKRQQTMNQQLSAAWGRQSKARCCGGRDGEGRCGWPLDLSPSAWPPLREPQLPKQRPPQPVAGMPTLFLDGSHARKEPIGTGVFLPRSVCNVLDPRKTTGRPTALVPARKVQASNLNLEVLAGRPAFPGRLVMLASVQAARCHRIRPRSTTTSEPSRPPLQQQQSWPTRLDSPRNGPIDLLATHS